MKLLIVCDNLYPELGGSYKAITDTHKILSENTDYKTRIVFNNNGKSKKNLDLIFLIKNFDIIHYFGGWSLFHLKVLILSFIFKKKTIITPMGIFEEWSLKQKRIKKKIGLKVYQKFILDNVNVIHVTSEIEKNNLKKITSNKNIVVIPHGTYETNYKKKKFFQGTKKKALFFSRLHKKKGISELVDTWIKINNSDWELHIYGPDYDDYKNSIRKKIKNNKSIFIYDAVFENKETIFNNYDLFILPSKSENFGYVILEAMQYGLPVLTTNATPWKIIAKKNIGWIMDSNLEDFENILKKIFCVSKVELEEKSINAINFSKQYLWNNIKYNYVELYQKINQNE